MFPGEGVSRQEVNPGAAEGWEHRRRPKRPRETLGLSPQKV